MDIAEEAELARSVLHRLRDEERRVLELALLKGLTHREIAEVVEMPIGTVRTHTRRGIARTGDVLKLKCFEGPTSVENLAHQLFSKITAMGCHLERFELQETDTSTVAYTRKDWLTQNLRLAGKRPSVARTAAV